MNQYYEDYLNYQHKYGLKPDTNLFELKQTLKDLSAKAKEINRTSIFVKNKSNDFCRQTEVHFNNPVFELTESGFKIYDDSIVNQNIGTFILDVSFDQITEGCYKHYQDMTTEHKILIDNYIDIEILVVYDYENQNDI